MASEVIAITGGIGAGKSVVSRIVAAMGYDVYDCDSEAKIIMDSSSEIKKSLRAEFGDAVVVDGRIDRAALAAVVFSDSNALSRLNALVHGAVRDDFCRWAALRSGKVFVETALLYQSGFDRLVSSVWDVSAPREVRLRRAVRRDSSSEENIRKRIDSQDAYCPERVHGDVSRICNDDVVALLPQVLRLINR